eukprot:759747-Hanusia_phi.AAC.1
MLRVQLNVLILLCVFRVTSATTCLLPLVPGADSNCYCPDITKKAVLKPTRKIFASSRAESTCIITQGKVKCWGDNSYEQFGSSATPGSPDFLYTLGVSGDPKKVIAGEGFLCVIMVTGDMYCSGSNTVGQAGVAGKNWTLHMVQVNVGNGLAVVDAAAGAWHTCAILNNSGVKCWGLHTETLPACGVGPVTPQEWADRMQSLGDAVPFVPLAGTPVAIAAGDLHTCVVLEDGNVQCWGSNYVGELGYGVDGAVGFTNASIPLVDLPGDLYAQK